MPTPGILCTSMYDPLVLVKQVSYRGYPELFTRKRGLCSQPPPTQLPQGIKGDKAGWSKKEQQQQRENKKPKQQKKTKREREREMVPHSAAELQSSSLQDAGDVKHQQGFKGRPDKRNSCLSRRHLAWKIIQAGKGWRLQEDSKGCVAQACPALPPHHASALTRAGEKTRTLDLPQYSCSEIFNLGSNRTREWDCIW